MLPRLENLLLDGRKYYIERLDPVIIRLVGLVEVKLFFRCCDPAQGSRLY